jgi:hypothetical protein
MKIYHWFIPNRKNKFHPVALRSTGLIIFLAIFISIPLLYNIVTAGQLRVLGYSTNINIEDLFSISNQKRNDNGLASLSLNPKLNLAALAKANDMFADNYWAHVAPDGTTPWVFIMDAGYQYSAAGENLAKDFNTSVGVVDGWMTSALHRDNVLNSNYQDVGFAIVNGTLLGSETSLVVAMYGTTASSNIASASPDTDSEPTLDQTTPQVAQSPTPNLTQTSSPSQPTTVSTVDSSAQAPDQQTQAEPTATSDNNIGTVAGSEISLPIKFYTALNWGQKVSILLICTLILLFIMKHTLIWRQQKRGLRDIWLRAHPIGQMLVLVAVLVLTIVSGIGVVL